MNTLIATTNGVDYFNNILVGKNIKSVDVSVCTYYAPNGRQLRRAVEKAQKRNKKKGNGIIPMGFYTSTLNKQ